MKKYKVNSSCPVEVMDSEDPLFILYTSGSTGKPKKEFSIIVEATWSMPNIVLEMFFSTRKMIFIGVLLI